MHKRNIAKLVVLRKSDSKQSGFTLIEIMVVIVILGILAVLIVPKLMGRPEEAKIAVARTNMVAIAQAMEMYKIDTGAYPGDINDIVPKYLSADALKDPWGGKFEFSVDENKGVIINDGSNKNLTFPKKQTTAVEKGEEG